MVKLFGGRGKKEEKLLEEEISRQSLLGEAMRGEQDTAPTLSPELPLLLDAERTIKSLVQEKNPLNTLLPLLEPRIGVTNLDLSNIRLFQWSVREILTCLEIEMEEDAYNEQYWAFSEALKSLLVAVVNDAKVGWKMRELSVTRRHVAVGKESEKKSWWQR